MHDHNFPATTRAPHCDTSNGYQWLDSDPTNMCVKLHTTRETWQNARTHCQQEHGDLVVLDTVAKYDLIRRQSYTTPGGLFVWYCLYLFIYIYPGRLRKLMKVTFKHN